MTTQARPCRAPALPPADRRAALIEAAVPLVLQQGFDVTTKELAAAAGVAEGTIFRVFDSKDELVLAAASSVFARTDHLDELAAIGLDLPLAARLTQAVRIWQTVAARIVSVFVVFHSSGERARLGDPHSLLDPQIKARADQLVAGLLAPDAHRLRRPVSDVVRVMGSLVLASVHPIDPLGPDSTPEDIVDLLLHGVLLTIPPREARASSPAHAAYPDR